MPPSSRYEHRVPRVLHELIHFDGVAILASDSWQNVHEIVDLQRRTKSSTWKKTDEKRHTGSTCAAKTDCDHPNRGNKVTEITSLTT